MIEKMAQTLATLTRRAARVPGELHPLLLDRVLPMLDALGGRFCLWEGYRDEPMQEEAFRSGMSSAHFGESPHNFRPALAVDVALNPRKVTVSPHPDDQRYPWLWDATSPDAVIAWAALDDACKSAGLDRVRLRSGKADLPHIQLPSWRGLIQR